MNKLAHIMNQPAVVLSPGDTVAHAIEVIRATPRDRHYTYPMVVDSNGKLIGLCVMRDLILADPNARIADVMLKDILSLHKSLEIETAMDMIKGREIPEYPVHGKGRKLIGVVRSARLHELIEAHLAAIPGRMVGVDAEETVRTPIPMSVRSRLPWLMINLATAFAAGIVVGNFQDTIDKVVLLAAFLPVLAGQSGNTGAQALAITLRSLEREGNTTFFRAALWKELCLGMLHGCLTGVLVALVIYAVALYQGNAGPTVLACIGFAATIVSVIISGLSGAAVPVFLKKFGADPATSSSIILTTITDIVSMGTMLILASLLLSYLV